MNATKYFLHLFTKFFSVGTDQYRAPEVWLGEDTDGRSKDDLQEYSLLADCYSFAMVFVLCYDKKVREIITNNVLSQTPGKTEA